MWRRCVEAVAAAPFNPLGTLLEGSRSFPTTAMSVVDSDDFNRVVGLGIESPADRGAIETILAFYRDHGKSRFRVEVEPLVRPCRAAGMVLEEGRPTVTPVTVTKQWEHLTDTTPAIDYLGDTDVRRLDPPDAEAVGRLTAIVYGAFDSIGPARALVLSTVDDPGSPITAWSKTTAWSPRAWPSSREACRGAGSAVTHPRFRSRNIQLSLRARRSKTHGSSGVGSSISRFAPIGSSPPGLSIQGDLRKTVAGAHSR